VPWLRRVQPVSAAFPARRPPATAEQSTSVAASVTIRAALPAATLATTATRASISTPRTAAATAPKRRVSRVVCNA